MFLMDRFLHTNKYAQIEYSETFILLSLALLFHSLPTGIALGLDFQGDHFQDSALLVAILIHHFPEGMVMMVTVLYSRMKVNVFLIFYFLLSLGVGINTYLGIAFDFQSIKLKTMFVGIAIGTLGYVTFYEVLWKELKEHLTIKMFIAAMLGILFLRFYLALNSFAY
jgi:zinc transporter, ZIP family